MESSAPVSPPPPPPPPSNLKILLTVLFHSSCAISVTLISKSALSKISLPITLLALQMLVSVALLCLIGGPLGWIKFRMPLATWKPLVPLTTARLIGVLAKTYCLANVHASFYQIARGLLLPFTLLLSYILLRPAPRNSSISLGGCGLIMGGFAVGMASDYQKMTSGKGMMLGVGSSWTTAVESIVVKKVMGRGGEMGMWQCIYMSNCMALVLYIPLLFVSGELTTFKAHYEQSLVLTSGAESSALITSFLSTVLLSGLTTFLLTLATFLQISVTSPTTHMIVTAARGVAQSALAVMFLSEPVSAGRVWSMGFILAGSGVYGWGNERMKLEPRTGYSKVEGRTHEELGGEKQGIYFELDVEEGKVHGVDELKH